MDEMGLLCTYKTDITKLFCLAELKFLSFLHAVIFFGGDLFVFNLYSSKVFLIFVFIPSRFLQTEDIFCCIFEKKKK